MGDKPNWVSGADYATAGNALGAGGEQADNMKRFLEAIAPFSPHLPQGGAPEIPQEAIQRRMQEIPKDVVTPGFTQNNISEFTGLPRGAAESQPGPYDFMNAGFQLPPEPQAPSPPEGIIALLQQASEKNRMMQALKGRLGMDVLPAGMHRGVAGVPTTDIMGLLGGSPGGR